MTEYRLYLTKTERQELGNWIKKGKNGSKKIQYAQILVNSDENVEVKNLTLLKSIIGYR